MHFSDITFFNPIPWQQSGLLLLALVVFLFFAFRKLSVSTSLQFKLVLVLLRVLVLGLLIFALLDPYFKSPKASDKKWIGVLIDTSESMNVVDEGFKQSRIDRLKARKGYFDADSTWQKIKEQYQYKAYTFNSEVDLNAPLDFIKADIGSTDLISAVNSFSNLFANDPDLLGWIIFSDGNATDYSQKKKGLLDSSPFSLVTVYVGSDKTVSNVMIETPSIKDEIAEKEIVPLKIRWKSTIKSNKKTPLKVFVDGKLIFNEMVFVKDEKQTVNISIEEAGNHFIDIEMEPLPEEGSSKDNSIRHWVKVSPQEIRVFYAESFYKNENLFKEALEEDAAFKVDFASSLVGFSREKMVPFFKDSRYGFPRTREGVMQYDVIVLSDVKRNLMSEKQIKWIHEFVEQGGALIMIGGVDSFGDGGYVGTDIEKMLPVEISEEYQKETFLRARGTVDAPFRPVLAEEAENLVFMQLSSDKEENKTIWKSTPMLGGYNYVGRLKPGATALLYHPVDKSNYGSRVIMAEQRFGRGRVLAFTSDITYNWGQWFQAWRDKKNEWVFAKFWRNVLKWMVTNRERSSSPLSINFKKNFIETNMPIQIEINLPEENRPLKRTVYLEILKDDKKLLAKKFKNVREDKINWELPGLPPGDYKIEISYKVKNSPPLLLNRYFTVFNSRIEARHLEGRPDILKLLAEESQGEFLDLSHSSEVGRFIESLNRKHLKQHSFPFWNQLWIYLTILFLLCVDWFLRKKRGVE